MGFTIEEKALIISNELINNRFFEKEDQAKANVSIKQMMR
jgi:hypothetical protein